MRNIKRIKPVVNVLHKYNFITKDNARQLITDWESYPDYRLGQLLVNHSGEAPYLEELLICFLQKQEEKEIRVDIFSCEENEFMNILNIPAREYVIWGSRGKDGKSPLTYKLLKDMDTDHIEAVITYLGSNNPIIVKFMKDELVLRALQNK